MEGIEKMIEEVKLLRFQKGDVLIVKIKDSYSVENKFKIAKQIKEVIPPDLQVQVVISSPNTEFEILRRVEKKSDRNGTQVRVVEEIEE